MTSDDQICKLERIEENKYWKSWEKITGWREGKGTNNQGQW